ncbi:unnamed protein product [Meganyctiphanes norvegica]|uniref:Uncharacterized protein n=1 Tax=Meganyctiphanes norvegica TaxID=48144 RepID=A0AAV2R7E6_MEGNR
MGVLIQNKFRKKLTNFFTGACAKSHSVEAANTVPLLGPVNAPTINKQLTPEDPVRINLQGKNTEKENVILVINSPPRNFSVANSISSSEPKTPRERRITFSYPEQPLNEPRISLTQVESESGLGRSFTCSSVTTSNPSVTQMLPELFAEGTPSVKNSESFMLETLIDVNLDTVDDDDVFLTSQPSSENMYSDELWLAVTCGSADEVTKLINTTNVNPIVDVPWRGSSPLLEAHLRGDRGILQALMVQDPPDMDHIVFKEYVRRIKVIFNAADHGHYQGSEGVSELLQMYNLPGTVRDSDGCSLLHIAASSLTDSGAPLWSLNNIKDLVDQHLCYVNAVDNYGKTCLHHLVASSLNNNTDSILYGDQDSSITDSWLTLAKFLIDLGCDPAVTDNHGYLPQRLAIKKGFNLLAQQLAPSDLEQQEDSESYPSLLEAAGRGDTEEVHSMLNNRTPLWLMKEKEDPLLKAIKGEHRDTVLLLLSAGSSICTNCMAGNTSLEIAETTLGICSVFHAIFRKEFCNQLQREVDMVCGDCKSSRELKIQLQYLRLQVLTDGFELSKLSFNGDCQKLLTTVAGLGLSLSCQLLGMSDTGPRLNLFPGEMQPFSEALDSGNLDTMYVLCRDLKVNPFNANRKKEVPSSVMDKLYESEKKKLLNGQGIQCQKELKEYLAFLDNDSNVKIPILKYLCLIIRLGLKTILHKVIAKAQLEVNNVVYGPGMFSMLHIAAGYGRIDMVEYLLSQDAELKQFTKEGYTAAHIAAFRGYKACYCFILECISRHGIIQAEIPRTPSIGKSPITSIKALQHYKENLDKFRLLSKPLANRILNCKDQSNRGEIVLKEKCKQLRIFDLSSLIEVVQEEADKLTKIAKQMISDMINDVSNFCKIIEEIDPRYKGKVILGGPVAEKTEFFLPDTLNFYLEFDKYDGYLKKNITIQETSEEPINTSVLFSEYPELNNENAFLQCFQDAAETAMLKAQFNNFIILPPFFERTSGVSLYGLWHTKNNAIYACIHIQPVIKVQFPSVRHLLQLTPSLREVFTNDCHVYLTTTRNGSWCYDLTLIHQKVITKLSENQRNVLMITCFLSKLLRRCWWLQRIEQNRRHIKEWLATDINMPVSKPDELFSYFLEELAFCDSDVNFKRCDISDRVMSIFSKNTSSGFKPSYIMPKYWHIRGDKGNLAIIKFLGSGIFKK